MNIICQKCGGQFPEEEVNERFQGTCPKCLAVLAMAPTEEVAPPVEETPPLQPGDRIRNMQIIEVLGRGGMGVVYKAHQPELDRYVAVKMMPSGLAEDPEFVDRFKREAKALAALSHPNVVGVHDFGMEGNHCFLVMEYIDGANLRQVLREQKLTPKEAIRIVPQLCDALEFAHEEGVVHRDIKPENILMDRKGRVKIADFGLAKIVGGDFTQARNLTQTDYVLGTPNYMAPEQIESPKSVDHRADIYSMGVVFYEMLTGELPMGNFQAPSKKVEVDVRLDEVVLKTLEKEPQRRYQKASDVKDAVTRLPERLEDPDSGRVPAAGWLYVVLLWTGAAFSIYTASTIGYMGWMIDVFHPAVLAATAAACAGLAVVLGWTLRKTGRAHVALTLLSVGLLAVLWASWLRSGRPLSENTSGPMMLLTSFNILVLAFSVFAVWRSSGAARTPAVMGSMLTCLTALFTTIILSVCLNSFADRLDPRMMSYYQSSRDQTPLSAMRRLMLSKFTLRTYPELSRNSALPRNPLLATNQEDLADLTDWLDKLGVRNMTPDAIQIGYVASFGANDFGLVAVQFKEKGFSWDFHTRELPAAVSLNSPGQAWQNHRVLVFLRNDELRHRLDFNRLLARMYGQFAWHLRDGADYGGTLIPKHRLPEGWTYNPRVQQFYALRNNEVRLPRGFERLPSDPGDVVCFFSTGYRPATQSDRANPNRFTLIQAQRPERLQKIEEAVTTEPGWGGARSTTVTRKGNLLLVAQWFSGDRAIFEELLNSAQARLEE